MSVSFPEVRVGDPVRFESVSVFPLFTDAESGVEYTLSDEAIGEKLLTVTEVTEGGSVPDLLVDNLGEKRVLFIEGEQLIGAKQNRILNTSVLVPARTKMKIPVSCVEQGRWRYDSAVFAASESHSPSKLRYALKASVTGSVRAKRGRQSDQGRVWHEVGELHAAHAIASPTGAMSDAFDALEDRVAECRQKLHYVDWASGVAVAVGGKVIGYDLFDKPSTCKKVWNRLLSGVVLDALGSGATEGQIERAAVEEMLKTTKSATWEQAEPIGEGEEYRAESERGDHASALAFQDTPVHGSLLAAR